MDESDKVYVIFRRSVYDWDGLERLIAGILTDRGDAINTVERLNAETSDLRYIVEEHPLNTEVGLRPAGFGLAYDSWDSYYAEMEIERQNEARESAKSDALYIVETEVREIFMGERNRLNELEKVAHVEAKTNSTVGVVDKARMKATRAGVTATFAVLRDQLNNSQAKAMDDALAVVGDVTGDAPEWEMVLPKALNRARGHLRSLVEHYDDLVSDPLFPANALIFFVSDSTVDDKVRQTFERKADHNAQSARENGCLS